MKIFKFGGASVNSIERIKSLPNIISKYKSNDLLIIISAMGKTTNALEKVVESFYSGNTNSALELFNGIKSEHNKLAEQLMPNNYDVCISNLKNFYTEVEWLLHDKAVRHFDYYYDQIVSVGELLSTSIVSSYLNSVGLNNTWLDVRDIIKTDNNFRDAVVDFEKTEVSIKNNSDLENSALVITQGFIGCTDENESTTLGREGSDYTAAIFANLLNAESVTIWKDVEGVMNADPKQFDNAQLIKELSFEDVIEMAYYGAQVIHPKTIKPLQNKKIPLLVKCFLDANIEGTIIKDKAAKDLPPIIVIKQNQVLLNLLTQDFSFVGEKPMGFLYQLFEELKIKPNLIQTGAINVQICLDDKPEKVETFSTKASQIFDVQLQKNLSLITIRNYTSTAIEKIIGDKKILLQQQTTKTIQALTL